MHKKDDENKRDATHHRGMVAVTRGRWKAAIAAFLVCLLVGPAARADITAGLTDFRAGRFAEAFEQWQMAAGQGDARAALFVGVLYDTGFGVAQDEALAFQWYRRAAEKGSAAAAFNVGVMYDAGRGTGADSRQAATWYARAAAKNYPRAEYNLAMLYEAGIGVARNRDRAIQFYVRAAEHGLTAARAHLTALGFAPATVPHATDHSDDASPMRDFEAAQRMFLARGPGEAGRAVELFRRAAEQHNALAEYDLGYCYENGIGVPRDRNLAYRWYRSAVNDAPDETLRGIALSGAENVAGTLNQAQNPSPPHP